MNRFLLACVFVFVTLAVAPVANAETLFTSMTTPQPTVTGINSVPVGPSAQGTFRAAMAFTPTQSGKAQLLSMRGQCVLAAFGDQGCAQMGGITIQSDAGGKPSGQVLGSMGFHLLENAQDAWRVAINGNPTGGTFRLRYTEGSQTYATKPLPFNAWHTSHCDFFAGCQPSIQDAMPRTYESGSQCAALGDCYYLTHGRVNEVPALFYMRGKAGSLSAFDVQLTGGINPTVSVTQPTIHEDCGTLSPEPELTAGTKYWAVMTAEGEAGWNDWSNTTAEVMESLDGEEWKTAFNTKTPALRIDSGDGGCLPVAEPNPTPGTQVGPGSFPFSTIAITNKGVAPLTLSSATFTGPGADQFSLLNGEPGPLARPYPFPRALGVETVSILYVACPAASEGVHKATLTINTSDPELPQITYPVECLTDRTPPTVGFSPGVPDGLHGWWKTSPIPLGVTGTDPQPGSWVTRLDCSDSNADAAWTPRSVFGDQMSSSITGEGTHTASCKATDLAGNQSAAFTTDFKIDTRSPVVTPVVDPEPTEDGWNNAATSVRFECDDPEPGSGVDQPAGGGGSVNTETAGTDFTSDCDDIAGNVSTPLTATIRIDTTRPVITAGVTPAPNRDGWNNSDLTITFDCADRGNVQSGIKTDIADVTVTQETSGTTYTPGGTCADKAANQAVGTSQEIKLDTTAPTTTIGSGPPTATSSRTADIAFAGADTRSGVARVECRLDSGVWETCTSEQQYVNLADGPHDVSVRAVDFADNVDATPAGIEFSVDTVAPETAIESGPDAPTPARDARFTYSGDPLGGTAVAGYECRLDDGAWSTCGDYAGLADGEYHFQVRAIDAAGNRDDTPATRTWTVDTIAPQTSIDSGPDAVTPERSASFTHSGDALGGTAVTGYECRLDDGAWGACASYSDLADGEHRFDVRAFDAAGNRDDTPATRTWTVDTIAPQTAIDSGPDTATASRAATFTYAGDALTGTAIARYECRLDDDSWGACPTSYTDLADGDHRFQVRAVDSAGNRDDSPATHTWTVDTIAPQTTIDTGPDAMTAARSASFTYRGDPLGGTAIARYECRLDNDAWGACAASYTDLAAGDHRFQVRAIDAAGNADAEPANQTWTIDLAAPTTTITGRPAARSLPGVTFAFTATDAGGSTVDGFECRLDGAAYDACASGITYSDLSDGRHAFEVRATDRVGNVESPAAAYEWDVSSLFVVDDEATTSEDTPVTIDVSANDTLTGVAALTPDARSQAGGTVAAVGADSLRYTPPANWSGTDRFAYAATRGADTVSATVTVHVVAVNDPPAFRAGAAIVVDEDSGTYRAKWASAIAAGEPGQHVRFAVTIANTSLFSAVPAVSPQGELTFTPAPNAYGSAVAQIRALDDDGASRAARLTITVNPVDDAPTVTVARDVRCGRSNNGTFRLLVHDIDSDASKVHVSGSSTSDRVGLEFRGSGNERTVSITRRPGLRRATVTVRLADGAHTFAIPVRLAAGTSGNDLLRGTAGPDLLFGLGGRDRIAGRGGNDLICGGTGADRVHGGAGDDVVIGGRGDDVVGGGAGDDVLRGDTGADQLVGGPGDDILRGGPRADVFAPAPGADTLVDFNAAQGDRR